MADNVEPRPLSASIEVAAPPSAVWRVVADVRRTPEWSPECVRVVPLGALRVGCLLIGLNRRQRVRWATLSRVTSVVPGRQIGWTVLTNRSEWRYDLRSLGSRTLLTQTRRTPRGEGRVALWFTAAFLGGQAGHDDELERGMGAGLLVIKSLAEGLDQLSDEAAPAARAAR